MNNRFKLIGGLLSASVAVLMATSCAEGIDGNEMFDGGVRNSVLQSPEITAENFSVILNSDGTERIKVTWPVVYGAGGYECNVTIVDDPANPVKVVTDSVIDGCSFIFPKLEETRYSVSVRTLGNPRLGNTEAADATVVPYSTLLPATLIPAGEDLATYFAANFTASDKEVAYELAAGETYYLSAPVDFNMTPVTLRGDKVTRPTVVVKEKGSLVTQAGLNVKNINFDCAEMTAEGLLCLSTTPDASRSNEALGYKADGASNDCYIVEDPITFQNCNVKELKKSLLYGNKQAWSVTDFRVTNCIVQLNHASSSSVLNLYGSSVGLIKNLTVKNNTFYNLVANSSAYFIRYSNSSNSQPKKVYGNGNNLTKHVMVNNTFCKVFTNKDFGNNMPNTNVFELQVDNNIFYDVFRVYQYIQSNSVKLTRFNTIFGVEGGAPNSNDIGSRKDAEGNPFCTEEDPGFAGPVNVEFDLTQAKGGVNFRPTAEYAVTHKCGDPRWFE